MTKHKLTMQLWPEALINLAGNPVFDLSARERGLEPIARRHRPADRTEDLSVTAGGLSGSSGGTEGSDPISASEVPSRFVLEFDEGGLRQG